MCPVTLKCDVLVSWGTLLWAKHTLFFRVYAGIIAASLGLGDLLQLQQGQTKEKVHALSGSKFSSK